MTNFPTIDAAVALVEWPNSNSIHVADAGNVGVSIASITNAERTVPGKLLYTRK